MFKRNFQPAMALTVVLVIALTAQIALMQDLTWRILSTSTDASGNATIVEQASNGMKRETFISYYAGTKKIEEQRVTDIFNDGSRIITTKFWRPDGTDKEYWYKTQNPVGSVSSGKRWFFDRQGRRFFEKWDVRRQSWIPDLTHPDPTRTMVRIRYARSRDVDARNAQTLLGRQGFWPSLVVIAEGDPHYLKGDLQYYRATDSDKAQSIVTTLRAIEPLSLNLLDSRSSGDEPTDRHFELSLYAKTKPRVRFGYTRSRETDAAQCESALRLLGFTVEKRLVADENVPEDARKLLYYHRTEDKSVADFIAERLVDPAGTMTPTIRRISNEQTPPDFLFVLAGKRQSEGQTFEIRSGDTQSTPNGNAEVARRLKDVQDNWLRRLAPGQGVAHIVIRNAKDEVGGWLKIEIRDAVSGQIVRPGGSWENNILPAGRYSATALAPEGWAHWGYSLSPVQFSVRAGGITKVELGGRQTLGRVVYEAKDVANVDVSAYVFVHTKSKKQKYVSAANGNGQIHLDLAPGKYFVQINANKSMSLSSEEFVLEAGKTVTIRPINRGRIAVTPGNTPPGQTAGVSTLSMTLAGYLSLVKDDYVDVPAGEYIVANSQFNKRVVVAPAQTVLVQR